MERYLSTINYTLDNSVNNIGLPKVNGRLATELCIITHSPDERPALEGYLIQSQKETSLRGIFCSTME